MKEIQNRNRQIAAYIDSLGSKIPEDAQQSFLLKAGGSADGLNASTNGTTCSNGTDDCKGSLNVQLCYNTEGYCGDTTNQDKCFTIRRPYPTNNNVQIGCTCN